MICRRLGTLVLSLVAFARPASAEPLTYSGRLILASGAPVEGEVDLSLTFHTAGTAGTQIGAPVAYSNVVRLYLSSDNITSGRFSLYGMN